MRNKLFYPTIILGASQKECPLSSIEIVESTVEDTQNYPRDTLQMHVKIFFTKVSDEQR
jgi:hypothetical protein